MISWHDLYTVLTAVIPLYVAMILAYGSVRWWKIFSPDQCSGINRFVAIFAVPLLSFHFISTNNPYAMNLRFIAADTLQKILMLALLVLWANFTRSDGHDFLETDAEIGNDGKLHVTVRKSNASRRSFCGPNMTPRPSNLTGAEIYSLSTTPRGSNFNNSDFYSMMGFPGGRLSNFGPADMYSVQSSRGPTPRPSNFEENSSMASSPRFGYYPGGGGGSYPAPNPEFSSATATSTANKVVSKNPTNPQTGGKANNHDASAKELHMFVWSSNGSPVSDRAGLNVSDGAPGSGSNNEQGAKEIRMLVPDQSQTGETKAFAHPASGDFGGERFSFAGREEEGERAKDAENGLNKHAPRIVPFVFAKEYNVHPAILSTGVIFGMLIALPITLVYYILLGL
ncbi:hypothetical protein BRARA_G03013 [Brassica rapa]|uniref:Auxin efflux carrier component n=1 Tax=Brassica campestris TaxID=3711 RepID=A0A397YXJ7_BRACM|nr:hypothetical protein BRARA_G03013 [Brassica rapa]